MFAAHETTAITVSGKCLFFPGIADQPKQISWGLYELARHPEVQAKLREEIVETRMKIQARGETEFTTNDLDSMPYLIAVMKVRSIGSKHPGRVDGRFHTQEILRVHPVVADIPRYSAKDDVLPLANPITSRSGKLIHELPIPKGLRLTLSFYAYQT